METYLSEEDNRVGGIINKEYVRELYALHCNGNRQTFKLWPFYVFSVWMDKNREYITDM